MGLRRVLPVSARHLYCLSTAIITAAVLKASARECLWFLAGTLAAFAYSEAMRMED